MTVLLIAAGAAIGAPARYLTDRAVQSRHRSAFPWGTFVVNVVASLVGGVLAGAAGHLSGHLQALLGTGFCGALSTFSTFSYEVLQLGKVGTRATAVGYAVLSVVAAVAGAGLGWVIGSAG